MDLQFKSEEIFYNFTAKAVHPNLAAVLHWFWKQYFDVIVTSAWRADDTGIHHTDPLRAVDLRSWVFPDPERRAAEINAAWLYDPQRTRLKVCVYHDVGRGAHFHIQVHDRTVKI
jgi:hypothetical protein